MSVYRKKQRSLRLELPCLSGLYSIESPLLAPVTPPTPEKLKTKKSIDDEYIKDYKDDKDFTNKDMKKFEKMKILTDED